MGGGSTGLYDSSPHEGLEIHSTPEGPDTQYFRFRVPKSLKVWLLEPATSNFWLLGPWVRHESTLKTSNRSGLRDPQPSHVADREGSGQLM